MLARTQLLCVTALSALFCCSCGGSSTPGAATTAGADTGRAKDKGVAAGQTPTPSVVVVTLHVKDMGKRLNLL